MAVRAGAGLVLLFVLFAAVLAAQTITNHNLSGKYYFCQLLFSTDGSENITDIRSLSGSINFDGAGNFSFNGQQSVGAGQPSASGGNGTYSVDPAGIVTLTNPLSALLTLNARWGAVGGSEALVIGSSTETSGSTFDLFVAVQAPFTPASNASLSGKYFVGTLGFAQGLGTTVRDSFFSLQPTGLGGFSDISVAGHAANVSNGALLNQTITGSGYNLQTDGSGTALFPLAIGADSTQQLLAGSESIFISSGGRIILGTSSEAGTHDLLIGVKAGDGLAWWDKFWSAGLRFETGGQASSYSGSLFSDATGNLTFSRRVHQLQRAGAVTYNFTGANAYLLQVNSSGTAGITSVALGADGNGFMGAGVNAQESTVYERYLGMRLPSLSGPGVFLQPQGIVNGASFASARSPISPGHFATRFGSNLAPAIQTAVPPYPPVLGGVIVTINNLPAPIYLISPNQINVLVPYATAGSTATIVVNNNGQTSNSVQVPVAQTAPGIFSLSRNGIGNGAVLHTDYTLVNSANPAKRAETVLVYLTGLGAVNPPVSDGTAGGSNPPSKATAVVNVLIGGVPATVSYAGLAPLFPGLYQINVVVPGDVQVTKTSSLPLAVQTPDSFHDQVDLLVSP